jgi:hypothetical protein
MPITTYMTVFKGKNITFIERSRDFYWRKCSSKPDSRKGCFIRERFVHSISYYKDSLPRKKHGPVFRASSVLRIGSMRIRDAISRALLSLPWSQVHVSGSIIDRYLLSELGTLGLYSGKMISRASMSLCLYIDSYKAVVRNGHVHVQATGRMCSPDFIKSYKRKTPYRQENYVRTVSDVLGKRYSTFREWMMRDGKKVSETIKYSK